MTLSSGEVAAGRKAATINKLMEMLGRVYLLGDKAWEDVSMIVVRGTEGHDEPESNVEAWAPAKGLLEYQGRIAEPYSGTLVLRLWRDDYIRFLEEELSPQDRSSLWQLCEDWLAVSGRQMTPVGVYSRHWRNGKYANKELPSWIGQHQLRILKYLLEYCCTVRWLES